MSKKLDERIAQVTSRIRSKNKKSFNRESGVMSEDEEELDEVFDKTPKGREKLKSYLTKAADRVRDKTADGFEAGEQGDWDSSDIHHKKARNSLKGIKTATGKINESNIGSLVNGDVSCFVEGLQRKLSEKAVEKLEEKKIEIATSVLFKAER